MSVRLSVCLSGCPPVWLCTYVRTCLAASCLSVCLLMMVLVVAMMTPTMMTTCFIFVANDTDDDGLSAFSICSQSFGWEPDSTYVYLSSGWEDAPNAIYFQAAFIGLVSEGFVYATSFAYPPSRRRRLLDLQTVAWRPSAWRGSPVFQIASSNPDAKTPT